MTTPTLKSTYRTYTCGEVRLTHVGQEVTLSGWIVRKRDHGGVVFIDLRDNYGVTQVVFHDALRDRMQELRLESVILIRGKVVAREKGLINTKLSTGEIEVSGSDFEILSQADVLPFQIAEDDNAPEATRLKYRFLELRREKLHRNILLRSAIIKATREVMHEMGFNEFQTPILTSSSPEGARDFLVPSRFHPGKFFALPQAPQQFKQLLMVSGFDRYFQIAPCFRDEDPRADRSPGEFYQLDLEMSFVEQEDVFKVGERYFHHIFSKFSDYEVTKPPFPRIRYDDAIASYGSDKPDLRIPVKIENVTDIFSASDFKVFASAVGEGGGIFAINFPVGEVPSRKFFDETVAYFQELSGRGLAYLVFEEQGVKGSISKFVKEGELSALREQLKIKTPAVVFLGAGRPDILPHLGKLRVKLGQDLRLLEGKAYRFCWITDYPMYEHDPLTGEIVFSHNPFSMPQGGLEALNTKHPLEVYAHQYDIVCNGNEMVSGAIRNHSPETMYKAFEIAGYPPGEVNRRFGGMIRAFKFGAPPHGGFAAGIDRIVMLLAHEEAIREVIAFPLAQTVEDLLMGAPSIVSEKQLREAHIQLRGKIP